uniref:Uncharacterized protein n=1 Tax=Nothobranchius pienaari TaxID=704102 RepID=A0A1A8LIW5_9TELE
MARSGGKWRREDFGRGRSPGHHQQGESEVPCAAAVTVHEETADLQSKMGKELRISQLRRSQNDVNNSQRCRGQTPSSEGNQNRRSASHEKYRTCDTCSVLQAIVCSTGGNDGCGAEDPQVFDDK